MLLSNISFHPTLTPALLLSVPLMRFNAPTPGYPAYYFPYARCGSATVHPDYRPALEAAEMQQVGAVRALVQAFEDGAADGVEEGKEGAKRKGNVHFLASVFANVSMVRW